MADAMSIPEGLAHIGMISQINAANRKHSEPLLLKEESTLRILGISMSALYQAATCHRKCLGGDHVLEALAARTYNHACAAYSLISIGYYDEALSLVRSIGEVANLLSLSWHDQEKFVEWVRSTKAERIREFSPAKVRKLLEKSGVTLMDADWYSTLCESYTHVTPNTKPNSFNNENRNICGGVVQEQGVTKALGQLTELVSMVTLFYCKYAHMDDIFEKISAEATPDSATDEA